MLAVMHDPTVPIRDRMKAASLLLKIFPHESVHPSLTIRIPSLSTDAEAGVPDERLGNGSHSPEISHKAVSHSEEPKAPVNIETNTDPSNPDPPFLIDYSQPLTPTEIQEIKAAVHALRPDFDPSQLLHLYLCACGHWLTFPCDCASNLRGKHRMN
jgi:hypothetical protein